MDAYYPLNPEVGHDGGGSRPRPVALKRPTRGCVDRPQSESAVDREAGQELTQLLDDVLVEMALEVEEDLVRFDGQL